MLATRMSVHQQVVGTMSAMIVGHRATPMTAVVRCATLPQKMAARIPPGSRRANLACNAVPRWKRKNKKSSESAPQAPRVARERKPDRDRDNSAPSWSQSSDRRAAPAAAPSTKRVPKWLKRKKTGGQASAGSGPRPVGTMVFGVGGVPSTVKRVPRWLRRAKTAGQQSSSSQPPARTPTRKTETRGFSYDSTNPGSSYSQQASRQRASNNRNAQPAASGGAKRYPKWHRRHKKSPGLTPEKEFAMQRDRMAARNSRNGR